MELNETTSFPGYHKCLKFFYPHLNPRSKKNESSPTLLCLADSKDSSVPNAPPPRHGSRLENKGRKMRPSVRIHAGERVSDGRNRRYGEGQLACGAACGAAYGGTERPWGCTAAEGCSAKVETLGFPVGVLILGLVFLG
ncbi:hypothetical protein ES288_A01G053400v1 [Gossypium darwinii]|uniref:Uncharacterized protein n=1 Tax=Gossypium darwinii TaxID=34276 RepID=A0A5D2HI22_GOSDA|nr:hypothetical protein ES288_A01G053400v1 [Gossypium darwinii]